MSPEIRLHVEPGVVKDWDAFRRDSPPCSIALDGYVDGPPAFDPSGPFANFDHHSGVNRLATRSAAGQVLVAIYLGLFDTFKNSQGPAAHVYVNDCDQDVCLAYWLLTHVDKVLNLSIDMDIAQLIIIEDLLDATAGAIPVEPTRPLIRKQAWAFKPYGEARSSCELANMGAAEMERVIEDTSDRLTRLSNGVGGECDLSDDYEVLGGGADWQMIREHGAHARTKLLSRGVHAFVTVRQRDHGRHDYTVGRTSQFIDFPVARILARLNEVEESGSEQDRWGGCDTIGGSPRQDGSGLDPSTVEQIVEQVLQDHRNQK